MAFEHARNLQDAKVNPAAFALPASASATTNSTGIDFGSETYKPPIEVELAVPALSTTIAPDTRTATYIIETSTVSNFASIDQTLYSETFTGAGGVGIAAKTKRVRLPSNCARYVRAGVTFGASMTTGAAVSATLTVKF